MGIVHRDIKPANLIIDRNGVLKILDFGIARLGTLDQSEPGTVVGSLYYMSPEQRRGGRIDHSTDIFAAGTVLYELLCAHPLLVGTQSDLTWRSFELRDPVAVPAAMPSAIRSIVLRALEEDPAGRYRDCDQMRDAIAAARAGLRIRSLG
jgi:eukaryotic-like serine/threonine-protein kinase